MIDAGPHLAPSRTHVIAILLLSKKHRQQNRSPKSLNDYQLEAAGFSLVNKHKKPIEHTRKGQNIVIRFSAQLFPIYNPIFPLSAARHSPLNMPYHSFTARYDPPTLKAPSCPDGIEQLNNCLPYLYCLAYRQASTSHLQKKAEKIHTLQPSKGTNIEMSCRRISSARASGGLMIVPACLFRNRTMGWWARGRC